MYHQNGNSPSSPESISSYIGSPGPSGVIQPAIMPIFQHNSCTAPRTDIMLPYLHILNQPQSKFRFRYASEMTGTHGCLMAESRDRNKKECIRVQLAGCMESEAIVRCTLVTNSKDPVPHVHKLGGDGQNVNNDGEYQDISVSASKNDWMATFSGLTIIHTAKKQVRDVVERRLLNEKGNIPLNRNQGQQLKDEADKIAITMDLHSVKLKFQAYVKRHDRLEPISRPVFSQAIHNLKSTHAGDLRIVRIDKVYSCCTGQEEIFIFVEKVNKKDIKIKFFETDDNEEEIWSAYADFSELDVHHQYAIAFKTPPYRDQSIEEAVNVWFQLYRPSNGSTSAPKAFTYTPRETVARKRPRTKSSVNIPGPSDSDIPPPRRQTSGQSHKQVPLLPPIDSTHSGGGPQGVVDDSLIFDLSNLKEEDFSMSLFSPMQMPPSNVQAQFSAEGFSWSAEPSVQSNFQPNTVNQLSNVPVQNQYAIPSEDAYAVFDEIANELPERAFTDLSTLLEQGNWMDYEGNYSVDASIISSDASQTRGLPQIKNRNGEALPSLTTPITDSSLTRTSILTNYILRMAAALRMYAGSGDTTHILNRFLHLMAMEDDNGDNALHCAIAHDQLDVAHHILKTVPNNDYGLRFVNAFNNSKLTPLHICVQKNLIELIPPLLHCGANPFLPNMNGDNVIHLAASKKYFIEGLRLLLELGVAKERKSKLNTRNYAGFSPLHLAIRDNNATAIELLLTRGSNVNLVEAKSGKSPLHLAVQEHSKDIVSRLLREPTIDINAQSYDGNTPLHLAVMEDLQEICKLLSNEGADPSIVNFIQQSMLSDDDADVFVERTSSDNDSDSTVRGITALDLASLNASVLEILKLSKDPPNSANDFFSPTASDTNSCFTDSGFDVSDSRELSKELNTDIIKQIASYLDTPSKGWEKLADSLDLLSSFGVELDKQPSPATYLLSNLDLWDIPSHVVLEKLHLLQFKKAAKLLEDYLGL